ncbi:MAG: hypothetical protein K1W21_01090 [Oscillospiraceae bacterium]
MNYPKTGVGCQGKTQKKQLFFSKTIFRLEKGGRSYNFSKKRIDNCIHIVYNKNAGKIREGKGIALTGTCAGGGMERRHGLEGKIKHRKKLK